MEKEKIMVRFFVAFVSLLLFGFIFGLVVTLLYTFFIEDILFTSANTKDKEDKEEDTNHGR